MGPLWEEWMRQVDTLLADRELVQIVYEALARRWPNSRTRERPATPAEVVLLRCEIRHPPVIGVGACIIAHAIFATRR